MGGSQSVEIPGGGTEGFHVLRVQDNSPGHHAGLEPFFDFIISICDTRLNKDNDTLKELLKANVERPVKMLLYSSKTMAVRETTVTPSNMWGGQGLLGVSIRFCSFEGAKENVWHVLEVEPNSPAALAGLRAHTDYIIGADSVMNENEDMFSLVETYEGKELKLYVYSTDTDNCREVIITPNSDWAGQGSLGCGIGYGYLHRIPTLQFAEDKKINFPSPTPNEPPSSPKDGFIEVHLSAVIPTTPVNVSSSTSTGLEQSLTGLSVYSNPTTGLTNQQTEPTVPLCSKVPSSHHVPLSANPAPTIPGLMPLSGRLPPFPHLPNLNISMTNTGQVLPGVGCQHSDHPMLPSLNLSGVIPGIPGIITNTAPAGVLGNTFPSATVQMNRSPSKISLPPSPAASESVNITMTADMS
ncbi:Golgi reassembly-stacking protein 2 isoform X1 [Solea senegalensis]|uniref:Golgi reassembly-stacking protein 2 isoform X1 n=2 Tax=Solea senegalensis TaxID=28829 RepID=A0AAV6RAN5_SOLSE|nr:Golgi reassembly-stacking protein 2-like isoform X2 [Solea senegalensis]KAG7502403.1 Golgi reassembly-stacking protein 2 isoform X1 [Solea senegalensis]